MRYNRVKTTTIQPSLFGAEADFFEGIKLTPPKTYEILRRSPGRSTRSLRRSLRRSQRAPRRLNRVKADELSSVQRIPETWAKYKQWRTDRARNEGPEIKLLGHYKPIQQNMNCYHGTSYHGASPRYQASTLTLFSSCIEAALLSSEANLSGHRANNLLSKLKQYSIHS